MVIEVPDWMLSLGVLAVLGIAWFALKRWIDKKSAKVKAFLDRQDWFTLMAMPVQITDVKPIVANAKWRLVNSKAAEDGAFYYTFEKADRKALSYSELLDQMGDPKVASTDQAKKCSFQMKIKAVGTFAEKAYAQTR